jgi:hypothetical protein
MASSAGSNRPASKSDVCDKYKIEEIEAPSVCKAASVNINRTPEGADSLTVAFEIWFRPVKRDIRILGGAPNSTTIGVSRFDILLN